MTPKIYDHKPLITSHLETLNNLLTPLIEPLKKQTTYEHKQSMTDYAFLQINEPPIAKENHYRQLSFEDIIAQSKEINKLIRRQKPFSYEDLCLNCGAPNEYIYAHAKTQDICCVCSNYSYIKLCNRF